MGILYVDKINNTSGRTLAGIPGTIVDSYLSSSNAQFQVRSQSDDGTRIPDLVLTIKPKRTTNIILCEWAIGGEIHYDANFRIHRRINLGNWSLITTSGEQGYNNQAGNVAWSGLQSGWYDANLDSTPSTNTITYSFTAGTTEQIDLSLALTSPTQLDSVINRTYGSWGTAQYEVGVSYAYLFEIYA